MNYDLFGTSLLSFFNELWEERCEEILHLDHQSSNNNIDENIGDCELSDLTSHDSSSSIMINDDEMGNGEMVNDDDEDEEEYNGCEPQLEMPSDENLNDYSHHSILQTTQDKILNLSNDDQSISFIFGLEVRK